MNGHLLSSGEVLTVSAYLPPEKKVNSACSTLLNGSSSAFNNLYVKNFPCEDFSDNDLRQIFEKYGEITSSIVMRDENMKSKGFGFVCFKEASCAIKALSENSEDGLYVREALTKE